MEPHSVAQITETYPCLSAFDAVNNTLEKGLSIGCRFVEVYESDVTNPAYQTMLGTGRSRS